MQYFKYNVVITSSNFRMKLNIQYQTHVLCGVSTTLFSSLHCEVCRARSVCHNALVTSITAQYSSSMAPRRYITENIICRISLLFSEEGWAEDMSVGIQNFKQCKKIIITAQHTYQQHNRVPIPTTQIVRNSKVFDI